MTNQHIITVPPELAQKCWDELRNQTQLLDSATGWDKAIALAYQAGADRELEACCEWLCEDSMPKNSNRLRAARRPKPPNLKEQALNALEVIPKLVGFESERDAIRQALETLPND